VVQALSLEKEDKEVSEVQELFPEEGGEEAVAVRTRACLLVPPVLELVLGLQL
jgi:hypothetical protein